MSRPMRRTSTNQFMEVRAERLDGAPVGERRRWSDDFKDRAIAASLEPGTNISALARSLDICEPACNFHPVARGIGFQI